MQGRGVACVRFTICIRAGQVGRMQGVNGLLQILGPKKMGTLCSRTGRTPPAHGPDCSFARAMPIIRAAKSSPDAIDAAAREEVKV